MHLITARLLRDYENTSDKFGLKEWSTDLPPSLDNHLDSQSFSHSMNYFNHAYHHPQCNTILFITFVVPLLLFFLCALMLSSESSHLDQSGGYYAYLILLIATVMITLGVVWIATSTRRLMTRLRTAVETENVYYRAWCHHHHGGGDTANATPVSVVWSLSSRKVIYQAEGGPTLIAEPVIVCTVTSTINESETSESGAAAAEMVDLSTSTGASNIAIAVHDVAEPTSPAPLTTSVSTSGSQLVTGPASSAASFTRFVRRAFAALTFAPPTQMEVNEVLRRTDLI